MIVHTSPSSGVYTSYDELPQHEKPRVESDRASISSLPFSDAQSGTFGGSSPSSLSFREDEQVVVCDGTTDKSTLDGVPTGLKEHGGYTMRMRMVQCRLYLLRCEVLQSRANAIEPKPWARCPDISAPNHYDEILKCARYAQRLAESVANPDLQARSKYWYGRGCGGLGDWEAAIGHFAAALKLHVPKGKPKNGMHQQRVVRQFNRYDAEFLLSSLTRHYDECAQKRRDVCKAAPEREAKLSHTGEFDSEAPIKLPWRPWYEAMIHKQKEKSATEKRTTVDQLPLGKSASIFDKETILGEEEMVTIKKRLKLNDGKEEVRKIFTAKEWLYILHGNNIERNSPDSQHAPSDTGQSYHSESSWIPSPASSITTPPRSSPMISRNLGAEMDRTNRESGSATPTPFESTRSPSLDEDNVTASPPTADLQNRRNVRLPPISTSAIHEDATLGEAVQVPFDPTGTEIEKD